MYPLFTGWVPTPFCYSGNFKLVQFPSKRSSLLSMGNISGISNKFDIIHRANPIATENSITIRCEPVGSLVKLVSTIGLPIA